MGKKPHATAIDLYVIQKVKDKRKEVGLTQIDLAQRLNMADSFVSNIESSTRRDKYNIRHLNELARIFNCSPKDFLPDAPL